MHISRQLFNLPSESRLFNQRARYPWGCSYYTTLESRDLYVVLSQHVTITTHQAVAALAAAAAPAAAAAAVAAAAAAVAAAAGSEPPAHALQPPQPASRQPAEPWVCSATRPPAGRNPPPLRWRQPAGWKVWHRRCAQSVRGDTGQRICASRKQEPVCRLVSVGYGWCHAGCSSRSTAQHSTACTCMACMSSRVAGSTSSSQGARRTNGRSSACRLFSCFECGRVSCQAKGNMCSWPCQTKKPGLYGLLLSRRPA